MDQHLDFENIPKPNVVDSIDATNSWKRDRRVWSFTRPEELLRKFSPSERLLLYVFTIMLALSSLVLLRELNRAISTVVPAPGGSFVEGETGSARFINPVLALSQADQDLTELVYSGLVRALPDGTYEPDLAQDYNVSSDGTTYTFTLRKNATFDDGTAVTSADVLFTVAMAQDPDVKSPHRADWDGVVASAPDAYTVVFKLPHAYAPFIDNSTIGILPKHLWQNVQPDAFPFSPLNTHPIGSGPYKIARLHTDSTGAPTRYDLVPFGNFMLGGANISRISFVFFANDAAMTKAFNMHPIDAIAGVSPSDLSKLSRNDVSAVTVPLPRVFGIFFNQDHNAVLSDVYVRKALEDSVDKQGIVDSVLGGYGQVLTGPLPPDIIGQPSPATPVPFASLRTHVTSANPISGDFAAAARADLTKGGWSVSSSSQTWIKKKQTLSLKLATADEPELVATANKVAADWRAAGIPVDVQIYPLSDFNNSVLRPRNYDAILFGEVVSRSGDLFAFWHSSQRNDPGLNLAMYTNSKADALLSQARAATDKPTRDGLYEQFATIVAADHPAIFLYSPDFIYIVPRNVHDIQLGALTTPSERFLNAHLWYTETQSVWNFFAGSHAHLSI